MPTVWLGMVIPKRLARRSVTRNLLRRQVRAAVARHLAVMVPGIWLVRLRSPFDAVQYRSAASSALRSAARAELDQLLQRATDR